MGGLYKRGGVKGGPYTEEDWPWGSLYGEVQGTMGNGYMGPSPIDRQTYTTENINLT